jgi:chromosome partitioning protein
MNLKGGAGKSTTVVHASVEAGRRGMKVLVVDTDDPQHSTTRWAEARRDESPQVITAPASKLKAVIDRASEQGFDLVIVDTAPKIGPEAIDAMRLSDLVLVPVKPDPFDMSAVKETAAIIKRTAVDSLLFLNCCPYNSPEVRQARGILNSYGLPVAATEIGLRRSFTRAVVVGQSVFEFEPKGKAAQEMVALMNEVLA